MLCVPAATTFCLTHGTRITWDRSPSLLEEAKEDPYTTPVEKQEDIKLEGVKLEDVKHEDATSTALALTTPQASTTPMLPPPPKTPPILPPPYTRHNLHPATTPRDQQTRRQQTTSTTTPFYLLIHQQRGPHQRSDTSKITSRSAPASTTSTTPLPSHTYRSSTVPYPLPRDTFPTQNPPILSDPTQNPRSHPKPLAIFWAQLLQHTRPNGCGIQCKNEALRTETQPTKHSCSA